MLSISRFSPGAGGQPAPDEVSFRAFDPPATAPALPDGAAAGEHPFRGSWDYLDGWLAFPHALIVALRENVALPSDSAGRLELLMARKVQAPTVGFLRGSTVRTGRGSQIGIFSEVKEC